MLLSCYLVATWFSSRYIRIFFGPFMQKVEALKVVCSSDCLKVLLGRVSKVFPRLIGMAARVLVFKGPRKPTPPVSEGAERSG